MTNDNCLEGIRCPRCGQEEHFEITALVTCHVTDEGSEPTGDHHWDEDSITRCPECGFQGALKECRRGATLPPDPDGMNGKRSGWAGQAIAAFMHATGTDREDALSDLLADLMHWSDRSGLPFAAELDRARNHYGAETLGGSERQEGDRP